MKTFKEENEMMVDMCVPLVTARSTQLALSNAGKFRLCLCTVLSYIIKSSLRQPWKCCLVPLAFYFNFILAGRSPGSPSRSFINDGSTCSTCII